MVTPQGTSLDVHAKELLDAHQGPLPLILMNVWDVASARVVAGAGYRVIATSSRAIAASLGLDDDDSSDPDVIFDIIARIARSVSCPVTADLEGGYRLEPSELVERMLDAGIVGCNLEDSDHHGDAVLVDATEQAAFLAEVREAANRAGVHIVINARIDNFIRRVGDDDDQLEDAVRRGRLYLDAGADCVYPISLVDRERIARLVTALRGPVNITARRGGLSVAELTTLGVRRISFASGLFQLGNDLLQRAIQRVRETNDLDALWHGLPVAPS